MDKITHSIQNSTIFHLFVLSASETHLFLQTTILATNGVLLPAFFLLCPLSRGLCSPILFQSVYLSFFTSAHNFGLQGHLSPGITKSHSYTLTDKPGQTKYIQTTIGRIISRQKNSPPIHLRGVFIFYPSIRNDHQRA